MAKATTRKVKRRGAKASRSSFRAKPAKKPAAKKPTAKKPVAKKKPAKQPTRRKRPSTPPPEIPTIALGDITVPSGELGIFDVGLVGYLPREALDPAIVKCEVPRDRPLAVVGTQVGKGRFAERWDHISIVLGTGEPARSKKLGEAGVDFARVACMDTAMLDHWQHEDSLDGRADFVFWGRDDRLLAAAMVAPRQSEGYGWLNLPVADAEAKADLAARKKAENKWLLATDLRPHSHHYQVLAAARAARTGAGTLELAGARMLMFFTSWGDGVFPIYLDRDADDHPVRIRIQLASPA